MTDPLSRCWCGRSVSWDGVECAEHDDAPVRDAMNCHPTGRELPQTADIFDYLRQKGEIQ